jgi:hypothetical protein
VPQLDVADAALTDQAPDVADANAEIEGCSFEQGGLNGLHVVVRRDDAAR